MLNRRKATRFSQKRGKTDPQAGRAANETVTGAVHRVRSTVSFWSVLSFFNLS